MNVLEGGFSITSQMNNAIYNHGGAFNGNNISFSASTGSSGSGAALKLAIGTVIGLNASVINDRSKPAVEVESGSVEITGGSYPANGSPDGALYVGGTVTLKGGTFSNTSFLSKAISVGTNITYASLLEKGCGYTADNGTTFLTDENAIGAATSLTVKAVPAPSAHTHAVSVGCETDSGAQVEFQPLPDMSASNSSGYTLAGGSYYLTANAAVGGSLTINGNVTLCLNGYTLSFSGGTEIEGNASAAISVPRGSSLSVCDCGQSKGKIAYQAGGPRGHAAIGGAGDVTLYGCAVEISKTSDYVANGLYNAGGIFTLYDSHVSATHTISGSDKTPFATAIDGRPGSTTFIHGSSLSATVRNGTAYTDGNSGAYGLNLNNGSTAYLLGRPTITASNDTGTNNFAGVYVPSSSAQLWLSKDGEAYSGNALTIKVSKHNYSEGGTVVLGVGENGDNHTIKNAPNGFAGTVIETEGRKDLVLTGPYTILYISPEQLRSRTIEKLLLSRNVVRFVIDEAHCFSAWGQDFRVDYLYIGDFIRELQEKKGLNSPIPVSCFTATAKQKVISDIRDYFQARLGVELELFTSAAARENLRYVVLHQETEEGKYNTLRALVERKNCPTIVYVSRTRRTRQLAEKLTGDGFSARPYNGKMDPSEKVANQDAFIRSDVRIIVATSAFGMGVDKKDVGLVVHYDISDSLENYIQEAGRAGRDPSITAECYVLFHDGDLDKHFILLNQTKLSISEIQQVWKALKNMTRHRATVCCSPLEIARQAGWDDSGSEMETRVKTAVAALENVGYLKRGRNMPRVYADSITVKNMEEASLHIDQSKHFTGSQRIQAKRIIKALISSRSIASAGNDLAESRVDYLADVLGMEKRDVIDCVSVMRQEGLLADSMDMSAYIFKQDTRNRSAQALDRFAKLERFLLGQIGYEERGFALKELNEAALDGGISHVSVRDIRTILYYLTIKGCIAKQEKGGQHVIITPLMAQDRLLEKFGRRIELCHFILE